MGKSNTSGGREAISKLMLNINVESLRALDGRGVFVEKKLSVNRMLMCYVKPYALIRAKRQRKKIQKSTYSNNNKSAVEQYFASPCPLISGVHLFLLITGQANFVLIQVKLYVYVKVFQIKSPK